MNDIYCTADLRKEADPLFIHWTKHDSHYLILGYWPTEEEAGKIEMSILTPQYPPHPFGWQDPLPIMFRGELLWANQLVLIGNEEDPDHLWSLFLELVDQVDTWANLQAFLLKMRNVSASLAQVVA